MIFSIPAGYYLAVTYILSAIVGLCVGSFLNVVIYRVPLHMSIADPPSHCPKCNYRLRWYDNVPVVSYCLLKGRCRSCKTHISFRYTAVEITNLLLWLLSAFLFHENVLYMAVSMAVCSICLCVCFADLENMMIPDSFQIALIPFAVLAVFTDLSTVWYSHLIGCGAGAILFFGLAFAGEKILGREALGGGDIKFAVLAGLLLGWEKFLLMMLISSVSGSIVMLILQKKNGESREIPFAPFLTFGLLLSMLAGEKIIAWYLNLLIF